MTEQVLPKYIQESEKGYLINFKKPVFLGGVEVSSLEMREPLVVELLAAEMQNKGQANSSLEMSLFASLCFVSPDDIKQMPLSSYKRIQEAYTLFTD